MIEILQLEDSTRQTLTEMNSTMQKINYVSYEKKKFKGSKNKQKFPNNSNGSNSSSSGQKQDSTRNPIPRDMKMSAKQEMPSVMDVVLLGIQMLPEMERSQVQS